MADKEKLDAEELLEKIFYYMTRLLEVKEFSTTVDLLTDLGSTIVNADRASFWFWDKNTKQYWTLSAVGNSKITIPENTGIVGQSITGNKVVLCNAAYCEKDFNSTVDERTGYVTKSILCMPITDIENDVIGAFQVINKINENGEAGEFGEKDVKRLSIVAAFCEKSLESYLLYNEAAIDQLTGLKNRYAFYDYYNKKVVPVLNTMEVSFIMCDIDHFKNVNDTYGHNAGDIILKNVADIFKNNIDGKDEVVRWGGEEFIFILRGKKIAETLEIAEKIRREIEKTIFEVEKEKLNITMSFGVYEIDKNNSLDKNVKQVDDRLYTAKRTGRNKVVWEL